MSYVALSRLKSSGGLRMIGLNEKNILTLKKNASPCDEDEDLYRLRLMKIGMRDSEFEDLLKWIVEYPICITCKNWVRACLCKQAMRQNR